MLEVQHLSLSYGSHRVLTDLSFRVERGQMLCVCGESGCGKSSLLRAILGFEPCEGTVRVDDIELSAAHVDALRRRVAYVPQELALPVETVRQLVELPFQLRANRHVVLSESQLMADWQRLGLRPSLLEGRVGELSGGQRQRVMLSVAGLLGKPLLLADEPTSALDEESARCVLRYFDMLTKERQMAVVVVSHSPLFRALPNLLLL